MKGFYFIESVVAGNGPSGIAVSHILAGNRPYIRSNQHPDEMLSARLSNLVGRPLMQQDLRFLSQGLEGRTSHPVSLLMDALVHPGADLGMELPSLLQWRHHPERQVDHVVLGTSPPGGAWQVSQSLVRIPLKAITGFFFFVCVCIGKPKGLPRGRQ